MKAYTEWLPLFEAKKKVKSFKEFSGKEETASYPPPEYVVEPAKDDKGFALVKKAFSKMEKYFQPSIRK
jgi:hypothetical protein